MRRITAIIFAAIFLYAQTAIPAQSVSSRRIEEEKRDALRPTEKPQAAAALPAAEPAYAEDKYFKELLSRSVTYISDACNALSILLRPDIGSDDPEAILGYYKKSGIFPDNATDTITLDTPLRKGVAAVVFCKALDIKGGMALTIFGVRERYAMKELVYRGMMAPGDAGEIVYGKELAILLIEADKYLERCPPGRSAKGGAK